MDPLHYCYWLKGYSEITNDKVPDARQWAIIQDHLSLVFNKVTPDRPLHPNMYITGCGIGLTGTIGVTGSLPFRSTDEGPIPYLAINRIC